MPGLTPRLLDLDVVPPDQPAILLREAVLAGFEVVGEPPASSGGSWRRSASRPSARPSRATSSAATSPGCRSCRDRAGIPAILMAEARRPGASWSRPRGPTSARGAGLARGAPEHEVDADRRADRPGHLGRRGGPRPGDRRDANVPADPGGDR